MLQRIQVIWFFDVIFSNFPIKSINTSYTCRYFNCDESRCQSPSCHIERHLKCASARKISTCCYMYVMSAPVDDQLSDPINSLQMLEISPIRPKSSQLTITSTPTTHRCRSMRVCEIQANRQNLEQCVVAVGEWCSSRRLQLNPDKTELIWFGSRTNIKRLQQENTHLQTGSTVITPVHSVRNLGVYMDSEMSMRVHVGKVASACFYHLRLSANYVSF